MDNILFQRLHPDAIIPTKGTPYSAGFDVYSLHDVVILPGNNVVNTGIAARAPEGCYLRVAIRSGLAVKNHLTVSAGVIDRDYTGEIKIVVSCTLPGTEYKISRGERFAQLIPERIVYAEAQIVDKLEPLGDHTGFGSTGKF